MFKGIFKMRTTINILCITVFLWTSVCQALPSPPQDDPPPPRSQSQQSLFSHSPSSSVSYEQARDRIQQAVNDAGANFEFDEFRLIHAEVIQDGHSIPYGQSRASVEELRSEALSYHLTDDGAVEFRHPQIANVVLRYSGVDAVDLLETEQSVLVFVKKTDSAQKLLHLEPMNSDRVLGFYWFSKADAQRYPLSPIAWHFYSWHEYVNEVLPLRTADFESTDGQHISFALNKDSGVMSITRGRVSGDGEVISVADIRLDERLMALQRFRDNITLLGMALVRRHDLGNLARLRDLLGNISARGAEISQKIQAQSDFASAYERYHELVGLLDGLQTELSPSRLFGSRAISDEISPGLRGDPGRFALTFKAVKELSTTLDSALLGDSLEGFAALEEEHSPKSLRTSLQTLMLEGAQGSRPVAREAQAALKNWKADGFPWGGFLGMSATLGVGVAIAYQRVFRTFVEQWDGFMTHSIGLSAFWVAFSKLCLTNVLVLGSVIAVGATLGVVTQSAALRRVFPSLYFVRPSEVRHPVLGVLQSIEVNGSRMFQYINYWLNCIWTKIFPQALQHRLGFGVVGALPEDARHAQDMARLTKDMSGSERRRFLSDQRVQMEARFDKESVRVMAFYELLKASGIDVGEDNRSKIMLMIEAFMQSDVRLTPQTDKVLDIYQYLCIRTMADNDVPHEDVTYYGGPETTVRQGVEATQLPSALLNSYTALFNRARAYAEKTSKSISVLLGGAFKPALGTLATGGTFWLVNAAVLADWLPTVISEVASKGWGDPRPWVEPVFMAGADGGHLSMVMSSYAIFQWILGYLMDFSLFGIYAAPDLSESSPAKQGVLARFGQLMKQKFLNDQGRPSLSTIFLGAYRSYVAVLPLRLIALGVSLGIKDKLTDPLSLDYALHYLLITAPILSALYYLTFDTLVKTVFVNMQKVSKFKRLGYFTSIALTYGFVSGAAGSWTRTLRIFQHRDAAGDLIADANGNPRLGLGILHQPFWDGVISTFRNLGSLQWDAISLSDAFNTSSVMAAGVGIWAVVRHMQRQNRSLWNIYNTPLSTVDCNSP